MKELFEFFKKISDEEKRQLLMQSSKLPYGTYVLVRRDKHIEKSDIIEINKDSDTTTSIYKYLFERNFYSNMLSSNKCLDLYKRIHSANPMTVITKRKTLPDRICCNKEESSKKLLKIPANLRFRTIMESYFHSFGIYLNDEDDYLTCKEYLDIFDKKINESLEFLKDLNDEDKVIFVLEEDINKVSKIYFKYLKYRSFLKDSFNVKINNEVYGAHSFNNTLNDDKPTLLYNGKAPYVVSPEDAVLLSQLKIIQTNLSKIINKNSRQNIKINLNKEGIVDYRNESKDYTTKEFKQYKIFTNNEFDICESPVIANKTIPEVGYLLNSAVLDGCLFLLFDLSSIPSKDEIKSFSKKIQNKFGNNNIEVNLFCNRNEYTNYFNQGKESIYIFRDLERLLKEVLQCKLKNTDIFKLNFETNKLFDNIINILNFVSNGRYDNMALEIKNIYDRFKNFQENTEFITIENMNEFCFLSGQIFKYIEGLSEAKDSSAICINKLENVRTLGKLKYKIIESYNTYSYKIPNYSDAFINRVYQALMDFGIGMENTNIVKGESFFYFQGGLIGKNIFYIKKDKNTKINEINNNEKCN